MFSFLESSKCECKRCLSLPPLHCALSQVLEREYGATALDTVGRELDTLEDLDRRLAALSTEIEAKAGINPE